MNSVLLNRGKLLTAVIGLSFSVLTVAAEQQQVAKAVLIPAGAFLAGCAAGDSLCDSDEGPEGGLEVTLEDFYIDPHETSVAEYQRCVEAGACSRPFDYLRTHYCNYGAPGRGDYPQNCVNWQQALEYCQWRGGRLATELEWEKAARAGSQRPYPWGDQPASCERAVMDQGREGVPDTETDGCWRDLSWPRNSFSPNSYGLYDMVGGTSEWVMDWYHPKALEMLVQQGILSGPKSGSLKVIKGGSWDEKLWAQRVSNRFAKPITGNPDLYGSNGIRCAFDAN